MFLGYEPSVTLPRNMLYLGLSPFNPS